MRKILAVLGILIGALAIPSVAGAASNCPVGDNGWYWHRDKVMHCVVDGNHRVIAQYGAGGAYEGIVFDGWLPSNIFFTVVPGSPGNPSQINVCPGWNHNYTRRTNSIAGGWESSFMTRRSVDNYWSTEGVFNHFLGWPGPYPYNLVQNDILSCAFGIGFILREGI